MIRPDDKTRKALATLADEPRFVVFSDWLRNSLAMVHEEWPETTEGRTIRFMQGEAATIKLILKTIETARESGHP